VKTINITVHFERPEPWTGTVSVPDNFDELDYDKQTEILDEKVNEFRSVWIDEWDYVPKGVSP
jgi:hypothetical protein